MSVTMERIRLVILTDDDVRDALKLFAARKRLEMSEAGDLILREALADELAELAKGEDDKPARKKKRQPEPDAE